MVIMNKLKEKRKEDCVIVAAVNKTAWLSLQWTNQRREGRKTAWLESQRQAPKPNIIENIISIKSTAPAFSQV